MAKHVSSTQVTQAGSAAATAPADMPAPSRMTVPPQPQAQSHEPIVIQWSNDAQDDRLDTAGAETLVMDPETGKAGKPKANGKPAKPAPETKSPAEIAVEGTGEQPPDEPVPKPEPEPEPKPTPSERRREALRALEHERRARALETTLKAEQEGRKADQAARDKLEKQLRGGKLGDLLAARGMSREDALELLLRGGPDTEASADAPKPKTDLERRLDALEAENKRLAGELTKRAESEGQMQVERAVADVADMTKDLDIPVTRAVDGGHEAVMRTAVAMWQEDGRKRPTADYVEEAAERVETYFRAQKPGLAALADAARGKAPVAQPAARSIGRRTAARPDAKPQSLWKMGEDGQPPSREEIDLQIKRELGLRDRL